MSKLRYIKDVYKMTILNPSRFKNGFVQNLSSLTYDPNGVPSGMLDSVDGNNANFGNSNCFKGDGSGYLTTGTTATINQHKNFKVSFGIDYTFATLDTVSIINNRDSSGGLNLTLQGTGNGIRLQYWYPVSVTIDTGCVLSDGVHRVDIEMKNGDFTLTVDGVIEYTESVDLTGVVESDTIISIGTAISNVGIVSGTQFSSNVKIWDLKWLEIDGSGTTIGSVFDYPLSEPIKDPSNHTAFDTVGTNHATLVNGSSANEGKQDKYHPLQKGWTIGNGTNGAPIGHYIPASNVTDGLDAVGNVLDVENDGTMWLLGVGNTLINADVQALKNADIYNVWFDAGGIPKAVTNAELSYAITYYPEIYAANLSAGVYYKNITLK